jgi:soluble lytic murein transglycosylase
MARQSRRMRCGALLGLTLLLGAQVPAAAQRASETSTPSVRRETAMAVPTPARTGGVAGLPQPLAPSDAVRLRRIFDLQARGDMAAAARETERLDDRRLVGHVLADRWLRAGGRDEPSLAELVAWLGDFSDHPDAPRIHAMIMRRVPASAVPAPAPAVAPTLSESQPEEVPEENEPPARRFARNPALDRTVRDRAYDGDTAGALAAIRNARADGTYTLLLQGEVALALFHRGHDMEAMRLAADAARRLPDEPHPAFVAGLAAWSLGRFDDALLYFVAAGKAQGGPAALRAAAAFWTARTAIRARQPKLFGPWMLQASQEPRTFYGLIARRILGLSPGFAWERDVAGEAETAALAETAAGWRSLALLQIGQRDRAESELRRLWISAQGNPALGRAMLAVSSAAGMTGLSVQLAALVQSTDGRPRDFARFPVPKLEPLGGYRVDPALIYALARQESNFDTRAVSPAGARGLMQIMPATAAYILGDESLKGRNGVQRLHDPGFSLELGQRYLHHLNGQDNIGGDLIKLLAAYNNGPGNMAKWLPNAQSDDRDPFLFIESIPVGETRAFVQRVLAYSWIYASRLGLPSPSLDMLAAGAAPRFLGPAELNAMLVRAGPVMARLGN